MTRKDDKSVDGVVEEATAEETAFPKQSRAKSIINYLFLGAFSIGYAHEHYSCKPASDKDDVLVGDFSSFSSEQEMMLEKYPVVFRKDGVNVLEYTVKEGDTPTSIAHDFNVYFIMKLIDERCSGYLPISSKDILAADGELAKSVLPGDKVSIGTRPFACTIELL